MTTAKDKEKDQRRTRGNQFQRWIESWILKQYPDAKIHNQLSRAQSYWDKKEGKFKWFSSRNDLWGCIDLAVILPHSGKPLFIQATGWTHVQDKLDDMSVVPWDFNHVTVQLWQKKEPGRVVIQQMYKDSDGKFALHPIAEVKRGKYIRISHKESNNEL